MDNQPKRPVRVTAGIVLGIGLGGFADGIALHQIAQWHNMGSAIVPPFTMDAMRRNMAWDGWFHAAMLAVTILGVFMLWRSGRRGDAPARPSVLAGELLIGWGAFNLLEGVVDHHLLGLHHVRDLPMHVPVYDWAFLAVAGVGVLLVGVLLAHPSRAALSAGRNPVHAARPKP
jgi:uncharacterized membrane protein